MLRDVCGSVFQPQHGEIFVSHVPVYVGDFSCVQEDYFIVRLNQIGIIVVDLLHYLTEKINPPESTTEKMCFRESTTKKMCFRC